MRKMLRMALVLVASCDFTGPIDDWDWDYTPPPSACDSINPCPTSVPMTTVRAGDQSGIEVTGISVSPTATPQP